MAVEKEEARTEEGSNDEWREVMEVIDREEDDEVICGPHDPLDDEEEVEGKEYAANNLPRGR